MSPVIIGFASFVAIFGAALFGIFAARALPEHHLSDQTRAAVSVSVAVVGTLSALVIGLMISTASSSFSARSHEVTAISVDLIRMDRLMQRYGPEADDARAKLRAYVTAKAQELFPTAGDSATDRRSDRSDARDIAGRDSIACSDRRDAPLAPLADAHAVGQLGAHEMAAGGTGWQQHSLAIHNPGRLLACHRFRQLWSIRASERHSHRVLGSRLDGGFGRRHDDPGAGHTLLRPDPHLRRADAPRAPNHTLMQSFSPRRQLLTSERFANRRADPRNSRIADLPACGATVGEAQTRYCGRRHRGQRI